MDDIMTMDLIAFPPNTLFKSSLPERESQFSVTTTGIYLPA